MSLNTKFNLHKYARMMIFANEALNFIQVEDRLELEKAARGIGIDQIPALNTFIKAISDKHTAGEITPDQAFEFILAKIQEFQAAVQPEPQQPVEQAPVQEDQEEIPEDFWQGKLISEPNSSEFKQKMIEYKDLNIVPRRAGGRLPAAYNRDDTFSDFSKQSTKFLYSNPDVVADIMKMIGGEGVMNNRNFNNIEQSVNNAIEAGLSPSFYLVSYMKNGQKVQEIEDHKDGRISFVLSSPKIFEVFNNRFKQATGDDLIQRLNENGVTEINDVTLGKTLPYNVVAQTLKQYPNNGLTEFMDALIDKKYELVKKWIARTARSILAGEYYAGFKTRSLITETKSGDEFELPGEAISEQGRKMSIEEMEQQRQTVKDFMMKKFQGLKKIADKVVEKMERAGDAGNTSKYFKAEILQNLINTYQNQLSAVLDEGNLTSFKDMIQLKSTGSFSGYLKMNLDPEKMRDVDFRKLITGFKGRKSKGGEPNVETNVLDSFNEVVKGRVALIHALRTEFGRSHSKQFIAQQADMSVEQLNYLLSTGLQDLKTLYSIPTEEEYAAMLEERRTIRGRLADYVEAHPDATLENLKSVMILDIINNDFTGALKDKEIVALMKDVKKQGADSFKASLVPKQPEDITQQYNKLFKQKELYKKIIGDTLRWDMANWVETLLEMVESGEADYDSMNLFLSFINPHRTIREGRRYSKATPLLWKLYGFKTFEELPPEIQEELRNNGITSLPESTEKLSMSEKMVLFAFNRAENKIRKLWHMKQNLTKTASVISIDNKIKQVASEALKEIRTYKI